MKRFVRLMAVTASLSLLAPGSNVSATPREGGGTGTSAHAPKAAPPFARVYLATRGCTSCAHCRTSIRQMLRPKTKGAETRIGDDQIEVIYAAPQVVPLRDVIRSLAENRLHDLSLVDVLFEAGGVLRTARNGSTTFQVAETGQSFPLAIDPSTARPPDGAAVRVTALVEGWRDKGALSLRAREMRAAI